MLKSVVWLTAKRQQFRAMLNAYEEVANRHFRNSTELFSVIASSLQVIFDRPGTTLLRMNSREYFAQALQEEIRVLYVIDDLDSLDLDQQKRSIEVCQQLAGLGSRFLFATHERMLLHQLQLQLKSRASILRTIQN